MAFEGGGEVCGQDPTCGSAWAAAQAGESSSSPVPNPGAPSYRATASRA